MFQIVGSWLQVWFHVCLFVALTSLSFYVVLFLIFLSLVEITYVYSLQLQRNIYRLQNIELQVLQNVGLSIVLGCIASTLIISLYEWSLFFTVQSKVFKKYYHLLKQGMWSIDQYILLFLLFIILMLLHFIPEIDYTLQSDRVKKVYFTLASIAGCASYGICKILGCCY